MSAAEDWDEDELDEDYDEHEFEHEHDEAPAGARGGVHAEWGGSPYHARSLSLGLVAMAPLFAAYELGLAGAPGRRNAAEQCLFLALSPLGEHQRTARVVLVALAVLVALVTCYRRRVPLLPSAFRVFLEGLAAAVVLGPLLVLALRACGLELAFAVPTAGAAASAARAARIAGGAVHEELLFRVLLYGLLFLGARRALGFLGAPERASRVGADAAAVAGSSLAFAAFHLAAFTAWLGPGGEAYDPAVFTWRALAGMLLALLFRWRGPGVAAWCHALFNLGVLIGAGPQAFAA